MRVLYYIDTMHGGGAAKKMSIIINQLIRKGVDITIATNINNKIAFELDSKVKVVPLYESDSYKKGRIYRLINVIRRARYIAISEKPDVIVTVIPHVTLFVKLATLGLKIPTIFSDETSFARKESAIDHFVRHYFYRLGDSIVLLTHNDEKILGNKYPQKTVIHNPVVVRKTDYTIEKRKTILAIGPSYAWNLKGFDLLMNAFSDISTKHLDWRLEFAGHTYDASVNYLMQMASNLGIADRVSFLGFQENMDKTFDETSIYAMTSRAEGFSLALIEAVSHGCACVAFKCAGVIQEVTFEGKGTVIVEDGDIQGLSKALDQLMSNGDYRKSIADSGKDLYTHYDPKIISEQWLNLFNNLINRA